MLTGLEKVNVDTMKNAILAILGAWTMSAAQAPAKVDFGRDIQPLLREHCLECHGPSQQMRGLRLDRRRDALPNRVGANGARIVPGNSAESVLFKRVSGGQMPPAGPLTAEKVAVLKKWIDEGAEWPDSLSGERNAAAAANPSVVKIMETLRSGQRKEFDRVLREDSAAVNA